MSAADNASDSSSPPYPAPLLVLGIEASCDDTAAAVIRREPDGACTVLSTIVVGQTEAHRPFGGVVPEIAARSHVEHLDGVIAEAMRQAGCAFGDLDAVGATAGPGLVGGVMVGLTAGKAIAISHGLRFVPVNHLEGHALSVRIASHVPFPFLLLLVSGGHTQLLRVDGVGVYQRIGTTIDDAAGEAFDKTAKLLGLEQPGGPAIEQAAASGDPARFVLPHPLAGRAGFDFSFSGLKTALRLAAGRIPEPSARDRADLAASFQHACACHLADQTGRAMAHLAMTWPERAPRRLAIAGGVAANGAIRQALGRTAAALGWTIDYPPSAYCTDNGAMIAWAAAERIVSGLAPDRDEALRFAPRARWPLAPPPAGFEHGGGRKGPKA